MKFLLLGIVAFNFLSFCWSVIGVFKTVAQRDSFQYRLLQIGSVVIWSYSLYTVWSSTESDYKLLIVFLIHIFCAISFWKHSKLVKENEFSLAFSKDQPKKLVKKLFYKRVRHPFYMIYLLSYYSIALAFMNGIGLTLCFLMNLIYFRAARFEEAKFLRSDLATEYTDYMKETWMFFPRIR